MGDRPFEGLSREQAVDMLRRIGEAQQRAVRRRAASRRRLLFAVVCSVALVLVVIAGVVALALLA